MARRAVSVATLPPRLALSGLALVGGSTIPRTAVSDVALRTGTLALAGVGMIPAAAGSILRAPRMPGSAYVSAAVSAINYQPRVRRRIEQRLGRSLTDFALESVTSFADVLTYAPASLGVDFGLRTMLLRETLAARNSRLVWPLEPGARGSSTRRDPSGPGERYADRIAGVQLAAGAALATVSAGGDTVATSIKVSAPRPLRMSRESFAAGLSYGLCRTHHVAVSDPAALRMLDRVDTVLVDPSVLFEDALRVSDIREVSESDRVVVWAHAREALDAGSLGVGRHRIDGAEVVVRPVRKGLAESLIGEIRASGVAAATIDDDGLGSLRSGFDELYPAPSTLEAGLREALSALVAEGRTVAIVSSRAIAGQAVLRIGISPPSGEHVSADIHTDLAGAWRVVHALSAARTATRRGVELSSGSSALGALIMLPGIRGAGPGPVTAGSAAGLWTGYTLSRSVIQAPAPVGAPSDSWHEMDGDSVVRELAESVRHTPQRADARVRAPARFRLIRDGLSALRTELADPLTPVLATGSAASAVLGSPVDAVLVGSVLVGNAAMSAVQRLHSERAVQRLLRTQEPVARRVTNAGTVETAADALELGDVVALESGDIVPADCRLLSAESLEVDESSLTGESMPVDKQTDPTPGMPLAERRCMAYAGTTVLAGSGRGVVTATGARTVTRRADVGVSRSGPAVGLTNRLRELTRATLPASIGGGALVTVAGLIRGTGLRRAVTGGVAVAVAAVPEGLPLVATLAQQAAARRLTAAGVLVRAPRSIEALGRVDVVCFDKTGTLSENKLRVAAVERVDGWGESEILEVAARSALGSRDDRVFHSTDAAVVDAAEQALDEARVFGDADALNLVPFRSGRPYSAALLGRRIALKGSPEFVAEAGRDPNAVSASHVQSMAGRGLRVVAVAQRELSEHDARRAAEDSEFLEQCCSEGLEAVGLLGLSDTLRPEATQLVRELQGNGQQVRVLTGDHPTTAAAVATELGMDVAREDVVTGPDWENFSRAERRNAVRGSSVFARVTPEQKVEIVQALETDGRVCAMVGDGANDAAAIRVSSVGIGVASTDSDPARGAADIVLLDGRVGGLTDALDEGSQLWRRVRSAVGVLLGGNAGEVAFALIGSALSGESPLNARQLLLVNLMTDALPAAALAVSTPSENGSEKSEQMDTHALWQTIAVRGGATAIGALAAWLMARTSGRRRRASTVALVALVGTQLGQTLLESRSPLVVATVAGSAAALATLVSTPVVSQFLGCTPLGPIGWGQAVGCASAATLLAALAPRVLERIAATEETGTEESEEGQSTIRKIPTRTSTAYTSRTGGVSARDSVEISEAEIKEAETGESDTLVSVAAGSDTSPNSRATRDES
ncbi:cation-translocating P-type ATPase [Rhodococcus erythropolis]|uniref:cation-translocating P-type ATPase n=1 Tax=Rhodococcus erythropolis TaxID=1833 RepID=UPI00210A1518|nr:cation-translocating P-type ATPase [Rhodococcus erythropolis]MCQ4128656.1 cation-translocating P-type ATPase [Rhodococcus erythropolis]